MNSAPSPVIFDPQLVRAHTLRALPGFAKYRALFDETSAQLEERIGDVKRTFDTLCDLSPFPFLPSPTAATDITQSPEGEVLPFAAESFDLIASNLGLHWVNDVPGILVQIRASLKSDGLFIAALIGGQSLHELRSCLLDAELAVTGGISPRLSPTIDLLSASHLMQRAGFTLPVVDKETFTFLYQDMFALLHDLRGMGQTNAHTGRLRHFTRRAVFFEAARLYQERFANREGHIAATFDIIYLHGWK